MFIPTPRENFMLSFVISITNFHSLENKQKAIAECNRQICRFPTIKENESVI